MGGDVASMRKETNTYAILIGKRDGNRPLGRPRLRCTILKWMLKK
jgi:hypothetical protein